MSYTDGTVLLLSTIVVLWVGLEGDVVSKDGARITHYRSTMGRTTTCSGTSLSLLSDPCSWMRNEAVPSRRDHLIRASTLQSIVYCARGDEENWGGGREREMRKRDEDERERERETCIPW
jgi:hypothetical protein